MNEYHVLGLMSGSSLDGLDIAYCSFALKNNQWEYSIKKCETAAYSSAWKSRLANAHLLDGEGVAILDIDFAKLMGREVKAFVQKYSLAVDLIASHGHTVFHQPEKHFTLQIGNGNSLAVETGIAVVCDFRTKDVMLGGQGAPLVPMGDALLFSEFDYCLNLGGISNISFDKDGKRIAFDISPFNQVFDKISRNFFNKEYDEGGMIAKSGRLDTVLVERLNALDFYQQQGAKSLGREWVAAHFETVLNLDAGNASTCMRSVSEHFAIQIGKYLKKGKVLVTGGGAYNQFFIERLKVYSESEIYIPEPSLLNFKEAMIFAFLGVLRVRNEVNILKSVTGAGRDSCSGVIHSP